MSTIRTAVAAFVAGVVLAGTGTAVARQFDAAPAIPTDLYCPAAVAHRGLGAGHPEGTRAGFRAAAAAGARVLEFDVRFTADGYPVVLHDSRIDRTTNGRGWIDHLTREQLWAYRIDGSRERVPLLSHVLLDNATAVDRFLIEIKRQPVAPEDIATAIRWIKGSVDPAKVIVSSFDADALTPFREAGLRTALIGGEERVPVEQVAAVGDAFVAMASTVDRAYVAELVAGGVGEVYAWTVNGPISWQMMAEAGVTGAITDRTAVYMRTACRR